MQYSTQKQGISKGQGLKGSKSKSYIFPCLTCPMLCKSQTEHIIKQHTLQIMAGFKEALHDLGRFFFQHIFPFMFYTGHMYQFFEALFCRYISTKLMVCNPQYKNSQGVNSATWYRITTHNSLQTSRHDLEIQSFFLLCRWWLRLRLPASHQSSILSFILYLFTQHNPSSSHSLPYSGFSGQRKGINGFN